MSTQETFWKRAKDFVDAGNGCLTTSIAFIALIVSVVAGLVQFFQHQEDSKEDKEQFAQLLEQQTRLVDESVKNWERDYRERVRPLLLMKNDHASVNLAFDTQRRRFIPSPSVNGNNDNRPVIINVGEGPAVQPFVRWGYGRVIAAEFQTLPYFEEEDWFPNSTTDILLFKENQVVNWIPKVIEEDVQRKVVQCSGTLTISCSGKQSYCAEYDFVATPKYNQSPMRVEFQFSNYRKGPCEQVPLRLESSEESVQPTIAPAPAPAAPAPEAPVAPPQ